MPKNDIFQSALVKKPKRARFDFSHSNTFGMKIGFAYPTEVRFIVPGDDVAVSMNQVARLAPMPVPTFADLKVRHDWFFVPCRLMYNERDMSLIFGSAGESNALPRLSLKIDDFRCAFSSPVRSVIDGVTVEGGLNWDVFLSRFGDFYVPGSLFDFLGYPVPSDKNYYFHNQDPFGALEEAFHRSINDLNRDREQEKTSLLDLTSQNDYYNYVTSAPFLIEPLLAYHYIWRDWYRFSGIQDSQITEPYLENHVLSSNGFKSFVDAVSDGSRELTFSPNVTALVDNYLQDDYLIRNGSDHPTFGQLLGRLRQVHLTKDMFTSVRYGSKPTVLIPTGDNANIPTLREASAIQRFIDLVSIVGSRYFDKVKALFNVKATGFADDRVQFLARYQQFIKIGEVLTTATTESAKTGDYAGRGILIDGNYLFRRSFSEPGWLMCITSVIPDIAYTGLSRQLSDTYFVDTPVPALAQIGDQTVYNREVDFRFENGANNDGSFGDQFRYYAYKSAPNEVHGSFKMESMRSWVPTQDYADLFNVIGYSKVNPLYWNKFFNDFGTSPIFGDRFYFKLDFNEYITRQLPKYINYHL